MTRSMTGFAEARGDGAGHEWRWEIRSVNGRGLDLRLRLPDGVEGLEAAAREAVGATAARGSVTLGLRLARAADAAAGRQIDPDALGAALAMLAEVEAAARLEGVALAQSDAGRVLAMPGVLREAREEADAPALRAAVLADLAPLIRAWDATRRAEGARMAEAVAARLDRVGSLVGEARAAVRAREGEQGEALRRALSRVAEEVPVDPDRLAQELALIAVRADVAEEIDRLEAHLAAARELLAADGPVGRKLDFLSQEFAREANTICAKAQSAELTRVGLDLKAAIDQIREQVQNLE